MMAYARTILVTLGLFVACLTGCELVSDAPKGSDGPDTGDTTGADDGTGGDTLGTNVEDDEDQHASDDDGHADDDDADDDGEEGDDDDETDDDADDGADDDDMASDDSGDGSDSETSSDMPQVAGAIVITEIATQPVGAADRSLVRGIEYNW